MIDRVQFIYRATKGNSEAQFRLACVYDFELPKNRKRAVQWYRRAAVQGHPEAQNHLGECLREGVSTKRSLKEAVKWFQCSAKQGNPDAQLSLGYALFYGKGVQKNWPEALQWYR